MALRAMRENGIVNIISHDKDFDTVSNINRIYPKVFFESIMKVSQLGNEAVLRCCQVLAVLFQPHALHL
jgi:hypothetical protein